MTTGTRRTGAVRGCVAAGVLFVLAAAHAGGVDVLTQDGQAIIRADQSFDIEVAGVTGTDPAELVWVQGNPTAHAVSMGDEGGGFAPGGVREFTIGVRNASPELTGEVFVSVAGLDPSDPDSLLPALRFTVRLGSQLIVENVAGADLSELTRVSLGLFAPGADAVLRLSVQFDPAAGNEYQGRSARVQVRMDGESR